MSPASKAEMFDAGMSKGALVNSFGGLIHLHDPADDLSEAEAGMGSLQRVPH